MKRQLNRFQEPNKRQKIFMNKRKCQFEEHPSKRPCLGHFNLKRKCQAEHSVQKKIRTDELGALHRMLSDAYAKIEYLEGQLREAKIRESFFTEKTNLPYNHHVVCY